MKENIPLELVCPNCGKLVEEIHTATFLSGQIRLVIKHGSNTCILTPAMARKFQERVHEIAELIRKARQKKAIQVK